jgi:GNAT superfamily N-acetyltransferase
VVIDAEYRGRHYGKLYVGDIARWLRKRRDGDKVTVSERETATERAETHTHIHVLVHARELRSLIEILKMLSEHLGCYKVTLDCKKYNVGFYEKCGFQTDEIHFMWKRFRD